MIDFPNFRDLTFGLSAVNVHEDAGDDVTKGREYGESVAPTNVIVVWIQ